MFSRQFSFNFLGFLTGLMFVGLKQCVKIYVSVVLRKTCGMTILNRTLKFSFQMQLLKMQVDMQNFFIFIVQV